MSVGRVYRVSLRTGLGLSVAWLLLCGTLRAQAWDDLASPSPGPSEAIGRYAGGCLMGGERLDSDGSGFQA
ncbi:MAG: hypothetical protein OEQ25_09920, partial [Gammaproteobacteria bacterium]|nr:hypothetical protein [Gammaproteobacteria bacterium]